MDWAQPRLPTRLHEIGGFAGRDLELLILDDEPDMLENCRRILGQAGYQCLTTTEPNEALALLESERPDR